MEHPEKLERINPALVDKMIRTEDAVSRGRAELARQELLRSAEGREEARAAMNPSWNVGRVLFGMEITLVGIAFELAGGGALGLAVVIIGFAVAFTGSIARPRTGP